MKISSFFKLVEIQTKVASVIPFFAGVVFAKYRFDVSNPKVLIIFFICLLALDMATTAINNLMDYKRAVLKEGFNFEHHNAIVRDKLSQSTVITIIILLLLISAIFGFWLYLITDIWVLLLGLVSGGIGVTYSFGPLPISRTPLGEIVSGFAMGGIIYFVTIYIQVYDLELIKLSLANSSLTINLKIIELGAIIFTSLPLVIYISNIMLANNICDIEDDVVNQRFTLPFFIGRKRATYLFALLNLFTFAVLVFNVIVGFLPIITLLTLITFIPVYKNTVTFIKKQEKATTFVLAVKNFVLFGFVYTLSILLGIFI